MKNQRRNNTHAWKQAGKPDNLKPIFCHKTLSYWAAKWDLAKTWLQIQLSPKNAVLAKIQWDQGWNVCCKLIDILTTTKVLTIYCQILYSSLYNRDVQRCQAKAAVRIMNKMSHGETVSLSISSLLTNLCKCHESNHNFKM